MHVDERVVILAVSCWSGFLCYSAKVGSSHLVGKPKIVRDDSEIDWNKPEKVVKDRLVFGRRGLPEEKGCFALATSPVLAG